MRQKPESWRKPRGPANHFTPAEVEIVRAAFNANRTPKDIAEQLKCSQRSINRYFAMLRDGRDVLSRETRDTAVVETKRAPVDRFYRGSFEL